MFCKFSSNLAAVLDPALFRFLTELVINLLRWHWVVIIEERNEELNPLLLDNFRQNNVSVTILTCQIETAMRLFLEQYEMIPTLLLYSQEVKRRNFLFDTCKIQWVVLMPDSSTDFFLSESIQYLNVLFVVPEPDGVFTLQAPTLSASNVGKVNSWHPLTGFENSSSFRQCSSTPIRHLKIAMEKHFPFFRPGNSTHSAGGSDKFLLDSLSSALKFTYEVIRPTDHLWGNRNGSEWNGMIGMLVRKEVDAALSGMTVNYDRHEAVRFSIYYAFDETTFVTRRPTGRSKTWAIFWPYTADVWISVAVSIVAMAALLTWLQTRLKRRGQRKLHFRDSLMYIFQSVLNQGYYNARETRCRVLMSFWWVFCITLIAGYSGSLMSFMAHPGFNPAIDTIMKLIESVRKGEISVGTIENSANYAVFSRSEEPDLLLISQSMDSDPSNLVHHDVDGLREALRRSYAYIGGRLTVLADVWDPSLFLFAKSSFLQYGYAIAFAPDFDHLDIFNRKILQLRESGLVQKWIWDIIQNNQHRGDVSENSEVEGQDSDDSETVLKVYDVQGAFAVLVIGLIFAIVCCIAEIYLFWKKRKRKQNGLRRWR